MARYGVKVRFKTEQEHTIYVSARDEESAKEKAEKMVSQWKNVYEAEALDVEEIE